MAPPPTTSTISPTAYSNAMANGYSVKANTTDDPSLTIMQDTGATCSVCNVGTLTNGMLTETSSASMSVMRTTNIHNSDAVASSKLDQHGELQHTSSTRASLQPAIVEAPDTTECSNNKVSVISSDGNVTQHIKQSLQSTDTGDMTVNDATEDVTESLAEDTSQLRNSEHDGEHGEMPDTPSLAHNQQNGTMEGSYYNCTMYSMHHIHTQCTVTRLHSSYVVIVRLFSKLCRKHEGFLSFIISVTSYLNYLHNYFFNPLFFKG